MDIITLIAFVVLFLLVVLVLVKLYSGKTNDLTPQMIDLKNELNELKTRQLESQQLSLTSQQKLLLDTQNQLGSQLQQMMTMMGQNLNTTQSNITKQLENSNRIIGDIHTKLGTLETTAKNIQDIGKDISSLQNILQAPKLRGNLGEYLLKDMLKQVFPEGNYIMEHKFKDGTRVDAVIKLGGSLVPIDSKFTLESLQGYLATENDNERKAFKKKFAKSVKDRIDETHKYIKPDEGTYNFAMMYIPAENVFYEAIIDDSRTTEDEKYEIFNYALKQRVILVSPNSFFAYIMVLAFGLEGLKIEQKTKAVLEGVYQTQIQFEKFRKEYGVVGSHLNDAVNKYSQSTKSAEKLSDQMSNITKNIVEHKNELIEE